MSEKLPLKKNFTFKSILPVIRTIAIVIAAIVIFIFIYHLPSSTSIDFTILRKSLNRYGTRQRTEETTAKAKSASETAALEELERERERYVNESRARMFVESATNDYYKGSYEEALRRLDRARIYDPCNFSAFKLSGQIFFEHNKYRKAFNDLEIC